jgi:hypothetical protein
MRTRQRILQVYALAKPKTEAAAMIWLRDARAQSLFRPGKLRVKFYFVTRTCLLFCGEK